MTPSPDYLDQMLARDNARVDELEELLSRERQALEQRDTETLAPLIDAKNAAMAALGESALERQGWLEAAGLTPNHDNWQAWLERASETRARQADWDRLAQRFAHCREMNEINGKIIRRAQQTMEQLLKLLRGQNNDGPSLYNAQGRSGPSGGSQSLAKA